MNENEKATPLPRLESVATRLFFFTKGWGVIYIHDLLVYHRNNYNSNITNNKKFKKNKK